MTKMEKTDMILDMVEIILDMHDGPGFTEYLCETGGDVVKYRVYDDGLITAR